MVVSSSKPMIAASRLAVERSESVITVYHQTVLSILVHWICKREFHCWILGRRTRRLLVDSRHLLLMGHQEHAVLFPVVSDRCTSPRWWRWFRPDETGIRRGQVPTPSSIARLHLVPVDSSLSHTHVSEALAWRRSNLDIGASGRT